MKFRGKVTAYISAMMIVFFYPQLNLNVNSVEENVFLYNELEDGTVEITGYEGETDRLLIPSEIDGKSVSGIHERAFQSRPSVVTVEFPDTLKSIGEGAFYGCFGIKSITIPKSVKSIGDHAFGYCPELESITIPEGDIALGEWAFDSTKWLSEQPDGCVYLGENDHIFYCYRGIMPDNTSIKIKDGTTYIASTAFSYVNGDTVEGYENLVSVELPDGVKAIGDRAFQGCINLTSINLPDGLISLGRMAFIDCEKLNTFSVSESLEYIDEYSVPEEAPWLGGYDDGAVYLGKVFYTIKGDKNKITSIDIKPGTKSIAYKAFFQCEKLETVTVPDSVVNFGRGAFSDCISLRTVNIPQGVDIIDFYTFSGCKSLSSITLPAGIKRIESMALDYENSLKEIIYCGTEESFGKIKMEDYVRKEITAILKYAPVPQEESSLQPQPDESSVTEQDSADESVQSTSENESRTESSEKTDTKKDTLPDNDNSVKIIIISLISAAVLLCIAIAVIYISRKNKKHKE